MGCLKYVSVVNSENRFQQLKQIENKQQKKKQLCLYKIQVNLRELFLNINKKNITTFFQSCIE